MEEKIYTAIYTRTHVKKHDIKADNYSDAYNQAESNCPEGYVFEDLITEDGSEKEEIDNHFKNART